MKAGVYYGARDIRLEDIEDPQIGPNDILIKVRACGICGSDLHAYNQGIFSRPGWIMGHELSGDVVAVGERVKDIKQGDRLVPMGRASAQGCGQCYWCQRGQPQWCETLSKKPCGQCEYCKTGQFYLCKELRRYQAIGYSRNGGYSEYVIVWDAVLNENVFKLPDEMSYDEGAVVEPLNGCLEWLSLAEPKPQDTAVVLGLGTIGLLMMQALKDTVSQVIVSELSPRRLQLAKELGADVVIDATQEDPVQKVVEATGVGRSRTGRGGGRADFVMECSGAGVALQQALEMTRAGGRIVLVGLFEEPVAIDPNRIIFKDLKLISSQTQLKVPRSQQVLRTIREIASGRVKVKPLISHEFPLEKIREAFETQATPTESIKVLIKP